MLQKPQEAADVAVLEAYECADLSDRIAGLQVAQEFYEKDKTNAFSARATEEEILLLKIEREQEVKAGETGLVDLSVTQLMDRYIVKGDVSHSGRAAPDTHTQRAHAHRTRTQRNTHARAYDRARAPLCRLARLRGGPLHAACGVSC